MSEGRRTYPNPPIREAICAVNFEPCENWDLRSPGEVYADLKGMYPGRPVQNVATQIELMESHGGPPAIGVRPGEAVTQLQDATGTRLFTFVQASLPIRSLKPYEGWEAYSERIAAGIDAYTRHLTPGRLLRVGVRYINQIEFESATVDLGQYFTKPPAVPDSLDLDMFTLAQSIESRSRADDVIIIQKFQSSLSASNTPTAILDIDVVKEWNGGRAANLKFLDEIEALRTIERRVFEELITDEARRLFNGN